MFLFQTALKTNETAALKVTDQDLNRIAEFLPSMNKVKGYTSAAMNVFVPMVGSSLAAARWKYVKSQCDLININKSNAVDYFVAACSSNGKDLVRNSKAAAVIADVFRSEIETAYKDGRAKFAWDQAWAVSDDFKACVQSMGTDADNAPKFLANTIKGIGEYSSDATRRANQEGFSWMGLANEAFTPHGWVDGLLVLPWNAVVNATELFTDRNFRLEVPPYGTMITDAGNSIGNAIMYEKDPETGKRTTTLKSWREGTADVLKSPAYLLWDLTTYPAWKEYYEQKEKLLKKGNATPMDVDMVSNQYFQAWTDVALTATIAYGGVSKVAATAGEKMVFSRATLQLEKQLMKTTGLVDAEAKAKAGEIIGQIEKELASARAGTAKTGESGLSGWYTRVRGENQIDFRKTATLPKTREEVANYISAKIPIKIEKEIFGIGTGNELVLSSLFSSKINKTEFSNALKEYNAQKGVDIKIELTDNDLSALRTEGASVAKEGYIVKNDKGYLFSSKIDKKGFAKALEGYNAKDGANIEIKLTDDDLLALKTEGASVTKDSYIVMNVEGKLNIYEKGRLNIYPLSFVVQVPGVRKMVISGIASAVDGAAANVETAGEMIAASAGKLAGLHGHKARMNIWLSNFKESAVDDVMLKHGMGISGSVGVRELPIINVIPTVAALNNAERAPIRNVISRMIATAEKDYSGSIVGEFNTRFEEYRGVHLLKGLAAEKSTFASPSKKIVSEMETQLTKYYKAHPDMMKEKNLITQVESDIFGVLNRAAEKDLAGVKKSISTQFGVDATIPPIMNSHYVISDLRGHSLRLSDKDKTTRLAEMIGRTEATDLPQGLSVKEAATLSELTKATGAAIKEVILDPVKLPSLEMMQKKLASQRKSIEEKITTNSLAIKNLDIKIGENPLGKNRWDLSIEKNRLKTAIGELKAEKEKLVELKRSTDVIEGKIKTEETALAKLEAAIKKNDKEIKKDAGLSANIDNNTELTKQNEKLRDYAKYVETLESSVDAGIIEARIAYVKAAYSSFMGGGLTDMPGWVGKFDKWLFEKKLKKSYSALSAEIKELDNGIAAIRARVYAKYDAWTAEHSYLSSADLEKKFMEDMHGSALAGKYDAMKTVEDMQALGDLTAAKTYRWLKLSGIISAGIAGIGGAGAVVITHPGWAVDASLGMGMGYIDYLAIGTASKMVGENNMLKLMIAYSAEREAVDAADLGVTGIKETAKPKSLEMEDPALATAVSSVKDMDYGNGPLGDSAARIVGEYLDYAKIKISDENRDEILNSIGNLQGLGYSDFDTYMQEKYMKKSQPANTATRRDTIRAPDTASVTKSTAAPETKQDPFDALVSGITLTDAQDAGLEKIKQSGWTDKFLLKVKDIAKKKNITEAGAVPVVLDVFNIYGVEYLNQNGE